MRAACIGRLCSDIPLQSIVDASFELSDAAKLLLVNGMCDEARDMLLAEDDDVEANTIQRTEDGGRLFRVKALRLAKSIILQSNYLVAKHGFGQCAPGKSSKLIWCIRVILTTAIAVSGVVTRVTLNQVMHIPNYQRSHAFASQFPSLPTFDILA
jgi:hypothetical protein